MKELSAYLFLSSLIWALLLTPLAIRVGRRWKVLDQPGPRKIHTEAIPLSGGWVIFVTISIAVCGHLLGALAIRGTAFETILPIQVRYFVDQAPMLVEKVAPMYGGALGIFVLGVVDDVRGISVKSRLFFQLILAAALSLTGLRPELGFLPSWMATIIGIIWIVGITNAFNFLDGLDGLSCGVALVANLALLTIMGIARQPDVMFYLSALAGTQLGLLRYNFQPARVFLGSSGSLLLGFLLAMSTVLVTYMGGESDNWLMPLLTPIFILAIPIYDTTSVVLIRLLQNRNIAIGDQSHFHHRLLRLGFSHRQTVTFIILISFSVALSGVRLIESSLRASFLILLQILGIMSILILAERVAAKVRNEHLENKRPFVLNSESRDKDIH